jgi:hypothetical protein
MNGPARVGIFGAIVLCAAGAAQAQPTLQPGVAPLITAETEHWFMTGEPLIHAGTFFYPAGAQVHFDGTEMVRSGQYKGVPLYSEKTAIEPFDVVFVALPGGLMQPYERRRTGELAGTSVSTAPSFAVASSAEIAPGMVAVTPVLQAAMSPAPGSPIVFEGASVRSSAAPAESVTLRSQPVNRPGRMTAAASPLGTPGRVAASAARRREAARPEAANGVFIEFNGARWFSSGPATLFDSRNFTQVGERRGFPVYTARDRGETIFVPVAEGLDLVAPYSKRGK